MNDRSLTPEFTPQHWAAWKITGLYLLIGGLWILFSDELMLLLSRDLVVLNQLSIFKGWVYIGITALLLYWLLRRHTVGLSQSEARYRSLFQNNHSVILLIDPKSGRIVDANASACTFYGYTHLEITSLEITAINQLSREQVFVEMERARQEQRRHFFFRHRLANGEVREVEVYSGPIEVQDKELLYSIVHDITARKQAETALHEMIENMAFAQRVAHFGSWEIELAGEQPPHFGRMVWSDESYRIFGYEPGTVEADFEFFVKHIHPDDCESVLQAISIALPETSDYSYEYRIIRPDGVVRAIHAQAILFRDEQSGRVVKAVGTMHDVTQRMQVEVALRESEEKYRTLLEALADGVFVAQDYRFVFANPALPAMLGYTPEAFVGLPFAAVITPEFLPVWMERFTQRIGSGPEPPKQYEVHFLCNGGERSLWVELRANRIEYQGRPAVMGIIRDITERKKGQEALRENEERLRLALMAANQGLYDLNIQTGEAQVSPEYATMLGYDPATFHETNAALVERLHPDDREPVADNYRAYISGEVPAYAVEFRQRTQTGDWKWILSLGKIVAWDSNGRPLRLLGTHTDIHARKLAEQQLLYQANLLQNVSDAIVATDLDFKITSWNRAAEAIYGWSAAEVMGRSTTDLFQVEYDNFQPAQIDQQFQEQGFWQGEVTQKSKSGATIQVMASVSLIRDSKGQPMGVVAVNRDITERRQAEAQLRRATTELIFMNDLLKHSTQPISVANMQGRFVRFNHAYEKLTGYQEEELLELTYEQLTPEPWHEIEAHHIATLLATGQAVRFEKEYRCKDGTVTPVELVIELYRDAQGEPLYTYGFATDISERKRVEQEIETLASFPTENPNPVLRVGLDGRLLYANPASAALLEFWRCLPGEYVPQEWQDLITAAAAQTHLSVDVTCGPQTYSIQLASFAADGYVNFYGQDITQREQAEAALRESEERLAFALEVSQMGSWEFNLVDHSAYRSLQHARIFGYEPPLPDWTLEMFLGHIIPEDRAEVEHTIGQAIAAQSDWSAECRIRRCDGEIRWIWVAGRFRNNLTKTSDKMVGGIVLDITARKQAEQALQESERRYRELVQNANSAIIRWKRNGDIVFFNEFAQSFFGYHPDQIIGQKVNILVPDTETTGADLSMLVENILAHPEQYINYVNENVCQDGRRVWMAWTNKPIYENGRVEEILAVGMDITERKQAEEKLRELQSMLAMAESVAGMGSWKWDLQTQKVTWSDEMFNLFGVDRANFDGALDRVIASRIHPDDIEVVNRANLNVLEGGQPEPLEYRIVLPDGRQRHVWAEGTLIRDSLGHPAALTGYVQDITTRKQVETALLASEARFRHTLDAMLEGCQIIAFDWRYLYINDVADRHNRRPKEELLGRRYMEMWPGIETTEVFRVIRRCMEERLSQSMENMFTFPDGTSGWFELRIYPVPEGIVILSLDITTRKQVEAQIQVQARRLQTLADTSRAFAEVGTDYQTVLKLIGQLIADHLDAGCVIRLLSEDGQWLEAVVVYDRNPAALQVTETVIRNTHYHMIEDAANPAVRAVRIGRPVLIPAMDPEQLRPFYPPELWLDLEPYCPRSALIAPLQVQKQALGVLSLSRYRSDQPPFNEDDLRLVQDLADRAALALSNARLFDLVQTELVERKRAEEELRQTAAELTRSNTDLEQFAYVASHDLQEPLRAVAGTVQLLQKRYGGQLDERADEFIHHAVEGATRMQTLINDLLVFSRVGTRGKPFRPVELAGVLADVRANLTVAIGESGAVISHDNLPTVVADRTQMIQLFQNLIANAIKFRGEQVPDIRIRAEQQAGEWLFAVADNGIGLEAQYFERIFGVFQRLHTRREYPGTGIGLALCKKIVERHGGRIWVESEPGQGSTFYFTLPERENGEQ